MSTRNAGDRRGPLAGWHFTAQGDLHVAYHAADRASLLHELWGFRCGVKLRLASWSEPRCPACGCPGSRCHAASCGRGDR